MKKIILVFAFIVYLVFYTASLYKLGPWEDVVDNKNPDERLLSFYVLAKEKHTEKIVVVQLDDARKKWANNEVVFEIPLSSSFRPILLTNESGEYSAIRINDQETEVEVRTQGVMLFRYIYSKNEIKAAARKRFNEYYLLGGLVLAFLTTWLTNLGLSIISKNNI